MKKSLTLLLAMAMATASTLAKDAKTLIKEFKNTEDAEYVHIPPMLMKLARLSASKADTDESTKMVLKNIKSMDVLCLDDCKPKVKDRLSKAFDDLESDGYEPFVSATSNKENVKIMLLEKKNSIRELVLLAHDGDDCTLILLEGDMPEKDIEALVESQTKDKKESKMKVYVR